MITVQDWIQTPKSITLIASDGTTQVVLKEHEKFQRVKELIGEDKLSELVPLVWPGLEIANNTEGRFTCQNGTITLDGEAMPQAIVKALMDLTEKGLDTKPLERFWDNLSQNPAQSSREDLYTFLTANNTPFTKDGCFIAYKMVKSDWWDSYTGNTHLNTPGAVIEMDRERVDPDRNNTCSKGLHVADFEYARTFSGNRLLEVKVNPRDVVAVPPDYHSRKMRVCKYLVLRETKEKYCEPVFEPLEKVEAELKEQGIEVPEIVEPETTVFVLNPDKEGRVRIPGKVIRQVLRIGAGKKVMATVGNDDNTPFIMLNRARKKEKSDAVYVVQKDGSIRLQRSLMAEAGMEGRVVAARVATTWAILVSLA